MPLVLYSTVSRLAYSINQRFYKGTHFVWCAPADAPDPFVAQNPPSSDPIDLYHRFERESRKSDGHSDLIAGNRNGIIRGASSREAQGIISKAERARIEQIALDAHFGDFSPLLLVIPYQQVAGIVKEVDGTAMAGATSQEFIIEDLPRVLFDVLKWGER